MLETVCRLNSSCAGIRRRDSSVRCLANGCDFLLFIGKRESDLSEIEYGEESA
nr:unnamed protein product [Callosobruchus chinensis]